MSGIRRLIVNSVSNTSTGEEYVKEITNALSPENIASHTGEPGESEGC